MNPKLRIILPGLVAGGAIGLFIGQGWIPKNIGIGAAVALALATALLVRRARRLPPVPAPLQETPMAPFTSLTPELATAAPGGTRTNAGGTYGDFVPNAVPPGMRDPSRGHELERDAMPAGGDFSQPPPAPDPAEVAEAEEAEEAAEAASTSLPAPLSREDRIRAAAFEKYQRRNGAPGDPAADWLSAEAEIGPANT